ncbi:MAG: Sigma-24 [Planctomycetota bacterium]
MSDYEPDIARLIERDDTEWLRVQREYQGRLYSFVRRRVRDRDACEDVLQETFLGAIRGIAGFDPRYSFEQYLFGILRNRTIDHLRRQRALQFGGQFGGQVAGDTDEGAAIEDLVREEQTPLTLRERSDLDQRGSELLAEVLREWVQETWTEREFRRLMVIEALFSAGWRNRDAWEQMGLRDQTTIAGIKFRALKRMRELTAAVDARGECSAQLAESLAEEPGQVSIDVAQVWRRFRVSCPARHWLARRVAGSLDAGMAEFVDFHIDAAGCPWCAANRDDLAQRSRENELEAMFERVGASTMRLLRSRGEPGAGGEKLPPDPIR